MKAGSIGYLDMVKVLVDAGADVNAQDAVGAACMHGMYVWQNGL